MKMLAFIFTAFLFSQQPSVDVKPEPVSKPVKSFASYSVTCQNAYGLPFVIRLLDPVTGAQVYATALPAVIFPPIRWCLKVFTTLRLRRAFRVHTITGSALLCKPA